MTHTDRSVPETKGVDVASARFRPEPGSVEALTKALQTIAYLRPVGPTKNKLAQHMERIAIDALSATPQGSLPNLADANKNARELAEAREEIERLRGEVVEAKAAITEANNSLFGSQGYFLSLNGGPADKYHLSRAIEDLKGYARQNHQMAAALKPFTPGENHMPTWKLVPVEPTGKMVSASWLAAHRVPGGESCNHAVIRSVYAAMLDAAPALENGPAGLADANSKEPTLSRDEALEALRVEREPRDMDSAPRDGSKFWGLCGDDAIAMFWHEGFGEFVSSFRRMEMAPGYTINGKPYEDHSPTVHKPAAWLPIPTRSVLAQGDR